METIKLKEIKFIIFGVTLSEDLKENRDYDWESLVDSIKNEGFLPEKYGYIIISKDNYCLDGYHRCTVLKELFGEDYEIKVIRKKLNYFLEVISKLSFYLFILKPVELFKNLFKTKNPSK